MTPNPKGPARRCEPGPHVHFRAVYHVTGISGNFGLICRFCRHGHNFQRNYLNFCMKVAENHVKLAYFLKFWPKNVKNEKQNRAQKLIK